MAPEKTSRPVEAILWMLLAGLCFVGMTAMVKSLGDGLPAVQTAFLRYAFGLIFVLPMLRNMIAERPNRRQVGLLVLRGVVHGVGVVLWFFAMTRIPLAEVTALGYITPVLVTIGAALFLGEKLAIRRILAIVAAFVGVLLILRPGFREISPGHLAMLGTASVFSVGYLVAKVLSDQISPAVIVGSLSVIVTILLSPFAVVAWETPTMWQLAVLCGVAGFATAGHYIMTLAFAAAPVTVTQPVTFLQLVWAVLMGALIFGESVDVWVVFGGLVIIAAISFITWREAVLRRRAVTPSVNETRA